MLKRRIPIAASFAALAMVTGCSTHAAPQLQGQGSAALSQFQTAESSLAPGVIAEYPIPTVSSGSTDITTGPDGNLWFTEYSAKKIGKMTRDGVVAEYGGLTESPYGIISGPDRELWFPETLGMVGSLTTSGSLSEHNFDERSISCHVTFNNFSGIAAEPDGRLLLTDNVSLYNRCTAYSFYQTVVYVISPSFNITAGYSISENANLGLGPLIAGPDGNFWFTQVADNRIGVISPSATYVSYLVPTASSRLADLAAGPDGNVWFTENNQNKIGKITPGGTVSEYSVPTVMSGPKGITAGPDGNLWFTEKTANKIGRITRTGVITEFPIQTANSGPEGITKGPDGNLWFVESGANKIAKFRP